jgi:PAS domain-containing protein
MISLETAFAIFDSSPTPLVFVDNDHIVRYNNRAAIATYCIKRGWTTLEGRSLFACHNSASQERIFALYARLLAGEDEILLAVNPRHEQVTLVAVRAADRQLLGYYERFTPAG